MAITYSIPVGPPTVVLANLIYALPVRACILISTGPCEVSIDGSTFAAHTSGQVALGAFVRCAAGQTLMCKPT